jgi:DNA sulfur modification protein DndB
MSEVAEVFPDPDNEISIEERHQRNRSERRSGEIADYILENFTKKTPYVLPPIVASLDGDKLAFKGGALEFDPNTSRLLINDGQHRHRGIQIALNENPLIADQEVGVWIIPDVNLTCAQQIFSDINKNAKAPSKSLNLIFDHRSTDVALSKAIKNKVNLFRLFTETEKGQASKGKLFVFVSLHKANCFLNEALVEKGIMGDAQTSYLISFWNMLCSIVPEWQFVSDFLDDCSGSEIAMESLFNQMEDIKKNSIAFHNGLIGCFGRIGAELFTKIDLSSSDYFEALENRLLPLKDFNFNKDNPVLRDNGIVVVGAKDKLRAVNSASSRKVLLDILRQQIGLVPRQMVIGE